MATRRYFSRARALVGHAFALFAGAALRAQTPVPSEINFFGDDFPPIDRQRVMRINQPAQAGSPVPALEHQQTLLFQNGQQLRGELAEITKDEVRWRRKDASEVLRFQRADVRRVLLVPSAQLTNQLAMVSFSSRVKNDAPLLATVKLPGSDWLRGTTTSPDGQTFTLTLKGGAPIEVARVQIEWLHFGAKPAPAFGLGEGAMALEGWLSGGTPRVESKDGVLTVHDTQWIGRALDSPARFEIAFEVPAESEDGLRLWLQPFNPQPNSYSFGTVQLTLGRKALKWLVYQDSTQANSMELPAEAQAETGPVKYRMLYDGPGQRVVLLRNGRQLGDWSLKPKVEQPGVQRQERLPRGLCFDRQERGQKTTLQFRHLSVLPWDGALPAQKETAGSEDHLSTTTPPPLAGRLEAVREKELTFAGQTVPVLAETFVKFAPTAARLAGAEALLSFGNHGEVSLVDLQMSDGKVRGRSVFAPALELPASALQYIAFANRAAAGPGAGDLLVFRNGDELPGALVAATAGAPLRWRLASGQEVDFQTERIAGVRLTSSAKVEPAGTVELRSGERLRGTVTAFDGKQLRWQHTLLGELAVDRAQLWRLYPNAKQSLRDGGQNPEGWLRDTPNVQRFIYYSRVRPRNEAWLALDGRFILRAREGSGEQAMGPTCELGDGLDRFELRVDLASPGDNPGTLNINFLAPGEGAVGVNLSAYQMNINAQNPKAPNGGGNREVQIREKIGENARQFSLRAFVNGPSGTIDFFLNGHNLGRTGLSAADRLPGVGKSISIDTYTYGRAQMLLSDVTITPWSGELPRFGSTAAITLLANGDAVAGQPAALIDARWRLESEIGPLDLASDKVQAVEFGGEMQPARAAGRLRLVDGSALLVDRFQWTSSELTAHHALFGELRIPASAVSELIYDPTPVRPATVADPKKLAAKPDAPLNVIRQ
jgi:hypothetical protein